MSLLGAWAWGGSSTSASPSTSATRALVARFHDRQCDSLALRWATSAAAAPSAAVAPSATEPPTPTAPHNPTEPATVSASGAATDAAKQKARLRNPALPALAALTRRLQRIGARAAAGDSDADSPATPASAVPAAALPSSPRPASPPPAPSPSSPAPHPVMDAASIAMSVQAHLLDITLCELASVDAAFDAWEPFTSMSPRRLAFQLAPFRTHLWIPHVAGASLDVVLASLSDVAAHAARNAAHTRSAALGRLTARRLALRKRLGFLLHATAPLLSATDAPSAAALAQTVQLLRSACNVDSTDGMASSDVAASCTELARLLALGDLPEPPLPGHDEGEPVPPPQPHELYWTRAVAGAGLLLLTLRFWRRWDVTARLQAGAASLLEFSQKFYRDWVLAPLEKIYSTIRYDQRQFALQSAAALEADQESLVRMVLDFAKDKLAITDPAELAVIRTQICEGDITAVMKYVEQDIKKPFVSLFFGELLRTVFIQVQKAKVDIATALSALDKIMRANELNFQVMGVLPTLLFLRFLVLWALNKDTGFGSTTRNVHVQRVRRQLLALARAATQLAASPGRGLEDEGFIFELAASMAESANELPFADAGQQMRFLDDLVDLLEFASKPSGPNAVWERLQLRENTLARMYRAYGFLSAK